MFWLIIADELIIEPLMRSFEPPIAENRATI